MDKHRHLKTFSIVLLIFILGLLGCKTPQNQPPVVQGMLYPAEVPASFEMPVICKVKVEDSLLRFQWAAENGTIKGDGESITWVAPDIPGTYNIYVNVQNTFGQETIRKASVNVMPFYRTKVDAYPNINLQLPVFGSGVANALSLVVPSTTAEISCDAPFTMLKKYKYAWSCNGGKFQGTGINDGIASKIGWISPGVPGFYTVAVTISDGWGNIFTGSVYFNVVNPVCCGGNGVCGGK